MVVRTATRPTQRNITKAQPLQVDNVWERMKRMYISQYQRSDANPQKILEKLYLGSVGAAYTLATLKRLKITHILTLCDCLPPKFPGEFEYKVVNVIDDPKENLSAHFKECFEFIKEAIASGGTVLVHCFAGVSRSSTVVIGYLMTYSKMSMKDAMAFVKSKRPWIQPNYGFLQQLRKYEVQLKNNLNN
ncbi:MKP2_5 [Blepharisma stoltei]|uniref:Uncharacterized protein n=1 Tax=Blepharisma stoltei TaxID=1481888 RepID=A0AAU9KG57_9CILI|nr:unnamed protein product [Blepharisma stoltei]